ncbi:MAG: polysaccharide deacetylase family protein, partial [Sarcina sp.]
QKTIEEITGFKPFILRFPFGCNNSLYRLKKDMVDMLHTNGFKIYDWNVDSTDGMYPKLESYKIANKTKSNNPNAIVLMHCGYVNKQSANALPLVIKYYKEKNYEFKTIDENTPEIYKVKKTNKK